MQNKKGIGIAVMIGKPMKEEGMGEIASDYNHIIPADSKSLVEGQEVEFSGSGKVVVKENGQKCIQVTEVNGSPVGEYKASEMSMEEKEQGVDESRESLKKTISEDYGRNMFMDDDEEAA